MKDVSSPIQILFNIAVFLTLVLLLWNHYNRGVKLKNTTLFFAVFLLILFCLYPYWGSDYWHYLKDFNDMKNGGTSNMEDIYYFIIQSITPNYFLFRLLIWGSALYILYRTIKKLKLDTGIALFFFVVFFLSLFSYARVSLAMTLIFYGLAYISSSKKISHIIWGIAAIVCSYFFHKSAPFGILSIVLALFTIKYPKFTITIFVISIPLLLGYIRNGLDMLMALDIQNEDNIALFTGQQYLDSDIAIQGISGILRLIIQRLSLFLVFFFYIKMVFQGELKSLPFAIQVFANTSFWIITLSFVMLISGTQFNIASVSYRLSLFAWIPSIFYLSYCKMAGIQTKTLAWVAIIGFISSFYSLVYSFYNVAF